MKFRFTPIALTCLALLTPQVMAGDAGMEKLFNEMGAFGNATGPSAYTAQGANIVTGGNLFMRVPQRNYKVAHVELPSLKFGCGGIDLFAGSFSFISKENLVAMMKNIGTAAVTYAFKLALDSISPQINKTLSELQSVAQNINATNINSCEAGQAIARGMTGDWQETQKYWAQVSGPVAGMFDDQSEARANTQGDDAKTASVLTSVTDVAAKAMINPGNVAWRALSALPDIDVQDRQLLMSLSGTVILSADPKKAPEYKGPKTITMEQFVRGDDSGKIQVYACADGTGKDECRVLGDEVITVKPFSHQVQDKLEAIAAKFKSNEKLTESEIKFINVSALPVYKALSVYTARKDASFESIWIARHSDLIAAEYAYQFVLQVTKQMQVAYTQQQMGSVSTAQMQFNEMMGNLRQLRDQGMKTLESAYSKVQSLNAIAADINQAERSLMTGLPSNLAGNVRFASVAR
jgi:conjugative transfer pilus assembly protein TraH